MAPFFPYASALTGSRGEPFGRIIGKTNSFAAIGAEGARAPASIHDLMIAISAEVSFARFPGGMVFFLPFLSKRPSTILMRRLSELLPGRTAGPISPPFIKESKDSRTSSPSGSLEAWQSRQYLRKIESTEA